MSETMPGEEDHNGSGLPNGYVMDYGLMVVATTVRYWLRRYCAS